MKIKNITEMVAGSVASVAMPLGAARRRTTETVKVAGLQPAEKVMTGKTKKKGPYANSLTEGKMKELQLDLTSGRDGLSDTEFKKKYGKTKDEMRKSLKQKPEQKKEVTEADKHSFIGKIKRHNELKKKVDQSWKDIGDAQQSGDNKAASKAFRKHERYANLEHPGTWTKVKEEEIIEAKLDEEDVIIVPGQGRKFKTGFIPHSQDRTDHEVEMALSDLFQAAKNAKQVYDIVKTYSEEQGLEGWVQEKIIKANDYLNTIREYLEHRQLTREGTLGKVAGGIAGAMIGKTPSAAMTGAEIGSALQDKLANESGAGVIAGGLQYEAHDVEPGPWSKANEIMREIFNIAKTGKEGRITIAGKSGTVSPAHAKAIINVYNRAKHAGREHEVLHMFVDTSKFTKLLRNPLFRKMVSVYSQEKPINLMHSAQAKVYGVIDKETGDKSTPTKPRIDKKA